MTQFDSEPVDRADDIRPESEEGIIAVSLGGRGGEQVPPAGHARAATNLDVPPAPRDTDTGRPAGSGAPENDASLPLGGDSEQERLGVDERPGDAAGGGAVATAEAEGDLTDPTLDGADDVVATADVALAEAEVADVDTDDDVDTDEAAGEGDEFEGDDDDASDSPAPGQPGAKRAALENEGEIAADYLEELLDIADLDGDIDTFLEAGRPRVSILTDAELLVGRNGEVLDALQELARLAVMTETGRRSRLMLDIAGHRDKRRQELEALAQDAVTEVKESGESVRLAPMNPFERKIVHDVVAAAGLVSESEGVEPQRRVVVLPA